MTTITIRLSENEKKFIKMKAAYEGKSITQYILEVSGVKKRGTLHEAIEDMKNGNYTTHNSLDELFTDMDLW